jgi:hypothetical protein
VVCTQKQFKNWVNTLKIRFESQDDIDNELKVMKHICPDGQFKKLGEHDLDFLVYDVRNGKKIGLCYVEIKCYNANHDDYPTTMVSCIKYRKMMEKALPTYLFIQWKDKLVYINRDNISGEKRIGGRKIRDGSTNDQELLIFVPNDKFIFYE